MIKSCLKVFCVFLFFVFISCNKKDTPVPENKSGSEFIWKSELKISDIPDIPLRGFINGKVMIPEYINFEIWRGSGDNVLNFGDVKPKNDCGFIESDNSFHLIRKSGEIAIGELIKSSFDQSLDGYVAYYNLKNEGSNKSTTIPWNCAIVITEINEETAKGKIAMCFNDDKKSWIAGNFEATRCKN